MRRFYPWRLMDASPGPALTDDLAVFLASGVAVVVATRDADMRPEITRGWGIEVSDGGHLTLCLAAEPGSRTHSNLAGNGAIAITASRPTTYRTVQFKGTATAIGEPDAAQIATAHRHLEAFAAEVAPFGIPLAGARGFLGRELVAVTVAVREVYDQTPGANAGQRL